MRTLPETVPAGFVRITGVPNTPHVRPYFASTEEAIRRCAGDPACVGVSAQRLFYGVTTAAPVIGRPGEPSSFMKR